MAAGGGTPKVRLSSAVMKARGGFGSGGRTGAVAPKHSTPDMGYGGRKNGPPSQRSGFPTSGFSGSGRRFSRSIENSGAPGSTRGVIRKVGGSMGSGSVSLGAMKGWTPA